MSDSMFRKNLMNPRGLAPFGGGTAEKIAILSVFLAAFTGISVEAALFAGSSRNRNTNRNIERNSVQIKIDNDFQQQNITGSNLDSYKFAQTHFGQSKSKLEQMCRAISSRYNDPSIRDIIQKIYVVDTQIYINSIKNSALAIGEVLQANRAIGQGLQDMRQIIMSPGQQTLEALEKTIDKVRAINAKQLLNSQKYLACLESILSMSQASYETFEIIPSLNMNELDFFVQASKQLMTNIRSHSESFKGLLLNVKSSSEQVDSGLTSIKQTIKETLRFSDHFAIKQFPLINLPTPSREKIFVQVNSLSNTVKGIDNTVSIGDSQVRNSSQQFTHLVSSFVAKSTESMKYNKADFTEKAQSQISTYARNQVCGLFLRIKEDVSAMRTEMAQAGKANGNLQPIINMETRSEYVARKAKSAAKEKLPLFLLGGKGTDVASLEKHSPEPKKNNLPSKSSSDFFSPNQNSSFIAEFPERGKTDSESIDLFNTEDFASAKSGSSAFITSEMGILQEELGSDFFFGDDNADPSYSNLISNTDEDLPSYGVDDNYNKIGQDSSKMQISYGNLENGNEPEVEMMRFESSLEDREDDLIPMMKYDSDILNFDELRDE